MRVQLTILMILLLSCSLLCRAQETKEINTTFVEPVEPVDSLQPLPATVDTAVVPKKRISLKPLSVSFWAEIKTRRLRSP